MMKAILPPAMLGVLGGGQLGRMFVVAARTMGYRVTVLDPDPHAPAAAFADVHLCAPFDDAAALTHMGQTCAAITTEFENVDADSMRRLAAMTRVSPSADCVAIAQDRCVEKRWINQAGLPTTAWLPLLNEIDLQGDLTPYLPGILKTARLGYDGKGQTRVNSAQDVRAAFLAQGGQACVLEKMLDLKREVSVIVARTSSAQVAVFPVAENSHREGILDISLAPARIALGLADSARAMARQLADALDYVGVLAVEFFVLANDALVINEIAPRPHNSGHFTLDACVTDQFQQQVRTLCGLLPGKPDLLSPVAMVNLLGDLWPSEGTPHWDVLLEAPNAHLHLYGKTEARPGRKMGHFNVLGDSADAVLAQAQALYDTL
jgi:5-(carboxyamino)imidazole ribonucleotide synthase